ncbi:hypothetical protein VP01_4380g2 [Puccinia sorghi]|uniref:Uncharacterized protein n=1 Tax=Puccinia sorghi TaxID=27349 RepID=A0A0L6UPR0_9BASI|nr:hypothetical protein VP01_4380g2 [Puccinia sorghi]
MDRTTGVAQKSSTCLLPYITLKGAKKAKINELAPDPSLWGSGASTLTPAQFKHCSELLENQKTRKASPVKHGSSLSYPPDESHLKEYINFLGMRNKEDTLSKLIPNGFNSHES